MNTSAVSKIKTFYFNADRSTLIYGIYGLALAAYLIPGIQLLAKDIFRYYREHYDTRQTDNYDPLRYRRIKKALQQIQVKGDNRPDLLFKRILLEILDYRFQNSYVPPNLPLKDLFHLKSLPFYPEAYDDTCVYRCDLSKKALRYPVCDPGDKSILYERSLIERYLERRSVSPVTGKPLKKEELVQALSAQSAIERRLRVYDECLESYIGNNLPNL